MITIELTPAQLWQLLSLDGMWSSESIVRYPWLTEQLKAIPEQELFIQGLYLDLSNPHHPMLWSANSWIEEKKRQEKQAKWEREYVPPKTEKMLLKEAMIAKGGIDSVAIDMILSFADNKQITLLCQQHGITTTLP